MLAAASLTGMGPHRRLASSRLATTLFGGKQELSTRLATLFDGTTQFDGHRDLEAGAPMPEDAIFRIYSMSKPITGVAMMQLYEQGMWQLDDPVTKHVPEFANLKVMTGVDADGNAIVTDPSRAPTMREIMSHTGGFAYGLSGDDPVNTAFREQAVLGSANLDELITKVSNIPLLHEPGSLWYYSVSVDIQGAIVDRD